LAGATLVREGNVIGQSKVLMVYSAAKRRVQEGINGVDTFLLWISMLVHG